MFNFHGTPYTWFLYVFGGVMKPKRFMFYRGRVYFTYKMRYSTGVAQDGSEYHGWDEWCIAFGLGEKWFGREEWYYDGHTFDGYCLFGLMIAKMYTYSWDRK